jgi:hypothetical protein
VERQTVAEPSPNPSLNEAIQALDAIAKWPVRPSGYRLGRDEVDPVRAYALDTLRRLQ